MGGPFLVPVREGAISHFEGVHELCGQQGLVNGDKVGFEGSAKICPGAKVWGSEGKGCYAPRAILVPCVHLCLPLLRSCLICTTGPLIAVYRTHFGLSR